MVEELATDLRLPGIDCVIVEPSGSPTFICRGRADVARSIDVDEHTVVRVASISKTFTAIGLMQLWEQGRFDLDEPANRFLTAYRLSRDDVTFRHLLTHTAGIGEVPSVRGLLRPGALGMIAADRPVPTLRDLYGPVQRVALPPGTKWSYANHGFATLAQLVEDISGRPFAEHMRTTMFEPLGMEHTDFATTARVRDRLAVGYRFKRNKATVPVTFREMTTIGGGGLYSCAVDMARYLAMLSSGGPSILKPETLELMLTAQFPPDGALPAMGLAFWLEDIGGRLVAGHGGDLPGFKSSMRFAPGGPGVFVSTNAGSAADLRLSVAIDGLCQRIMGHLLGRHDDVAAPTAVRGHTDLVGAYRPDRGFLTNVRWWGLIGGELEIVERNGALQVRTPWGLARRPLPLVASGERLAFASNGVRAELDVERDRMGAPTTLQLRSTVGWATFRRRRSSIRRVSAVIAAIAVARSVRRLRRRRRRL